MTTWEYKLVPLVSTRLEVGVVKGLNALGSDGWELCAVVDEFAVFKRPLPSPLGRAG